METCICFTVIKVYLVFLKIDLKKENEIKYTKFAYLRLNKSFTSIIPLNGGDNFGRSKKSD